MKNIKELLGKRIKELRKKKNLTQETLAEFADIEIPSLSNIETGKNYPNHETLGKIAKALNVEPYELFIFGYYKSADEMIDEMFKEMKNNELLVQKMYKFFLCVK